MGGLRQSGWYPDPNDNTAEVYWDGNRLHGRRNKLVSPQQTGQVTGKNPQQRACGSPLPD
jgi:hypothetical protein